MDNLTNHFLVAMPNLADPNFFRSVTYICGHNKNGAMGVVINRPISISLGEVFDHLDIESDDRLAQQQKVFFGGPAQQEHGFVIHPATKNWKDTLLVSKSIALTTSSDILVDIAHNNGPQHSLVALGYAGWEAGQLEQEMIENAWLSVPADSDVIFEVATEHRWQAAASLIGVDFDRLSSSIGHA